MTCVPKLLEIVRRDYPLLKPEYVVSISYELERELGDHQLDLAVLVNPTGRHGIEARSTWRSGYRLGRFHALGVEC